MSARPGGLDPYRPLFLIGMSCALAGTLVWVLAALHRIEYPGVLHRMLMIEGFEQSFIAGFLLTALGGLTHGGRTTTLEMTLVTVAQLAIGVAATLGWAGVAHGGFLVSMLVLLGAAANRSRRGRTHGRPPRELIFIVTALLLGVVGAVVLAFGELTLGIRLVAEGEVLTLVVGVGSILVPAFLGHRAQPLMVNVSTPGGRGQIAFYAIVALTLAGSFVLEMAGWVALAAGARAAAVSAVLLGVWKIHRSGSGSRLALTLRAAGFAIVAGLWLVVLAPALPRLGEHVVFVGGYGLLTMGIATRVIVSHGGWPPADEAKLLHPASLLLLAASLGLRVAAELATAQAPGLWAASGAVWSMAWLVWAARAVPRILVLNRTRSGPPASEPAMKRG